MSQIIVYTETPITAIYIGGISGARFSRDGVMRRYADGREVPILPRPGRHLAEYENNALLEAELVEIHSREGALLWRKNAT